MDTKIILLECHQELYEKVALEIVNLKAVIREDIRNVVAQNEMLVEENACLRDKLSKLERQLKKYSLVIYGLKHDESSLKEQIVDMFNNVLKFPFKREQIRDAYSIGKESIGRIRPIVMEVISYGLKSRILEMAKSLKAPGKGIYISNDLIQDDYVMRKFLVGQLKIAKGYFGGAHMKKDKLIVENKLYTYDYLRRNPRAFEEESEKKNMIAKNEQQNKKDERMEMYKKMDTEKGEQTKIEEMEERMMSELTKKIEMEMVEKARIMEMRKEMKKEMDMIIKIDKQTSMEEDNEKENGTRRLPREFDETFDVIQTTKIPENSQIQ